MTTKLKPLFLLLAPAVAFLSTGGGFGLVKFKLLSSVTLTGGFSDSFILRKFKINYLFVDIEIFIVELFQNNMNSKLNNQKKTYHYLSNC